MNLEPLYGPWQTTGKPGQGEVENAYWEVFLNVEIKPGTYTVIDSSPKTWSCNYESGYQGFSIIWGHPADVIVPPAPVVTGVANGQTYTSAVTPNWTDAEGTTSTAILDGAEYIKGTAVTASGTHTLVVTATKTVSGLIATTTISFTVNVTVNENIVYGDIDGDRIVTSSDYALIKRYVSRQITKFPAEQK